MLMVRRGLLSLSCRNPGETRKVGVDHTFNTRCPRVLCGSRLLTMRFHRPIVPSPTLACPRSGDRRGGHRLLMVSLTSHRASSRVRSRRLTLETNGPRVLQLRLLDGLAGLMSPSTNLTGRSVRSVVRSLRTAMHAGVIHVQVAPVLRSRHIPRCGMQCRRSRRRVNHHGRSTPCRRSHRGLVLLIERLDAGKLEGRLRVWVGLDHRRSGIWVD